MEDQREFKRFPVQLSARFLGGSDDKWTSCSVTNVSREGMGIEVYLQEQIHPGEILQFKIIIPAKEELIKTTGTVTWSKELNEKMSFIGGIKFFNNASEDIWNLLEYAYTN